MYWYNHLTIWLIDTKLYLMANISDSKKFDAVICLCYMFIAR